MVLLAAPICAGMSILWRAVDHSADSTKNTLTGTWMLCLAVSERPVAILCRAQKALAEQSSYTEYRPRCPETCQTGSS